MSAGAGDKEEIRMKLGSLFSGYGGLDMSLHSVWPNAQTAWVSDIDKGACKILAHRFPDVPNLGDITAVDWATVEPVDILTGGFPCQDVSHAGRRAGLIRGETRTGLWAEMLRGIATMRPRLVVAENVRGLLSARADSDVEPCPWCLGDADDEPPMRALGAVLADLADIGYDAAWCGLRAADVGAAHGRFRVFILAWPADSASHTGRVEHGDRGGADLRVEVPLVPTPRAQAREGAYAREDYHHNIEEWAGHWHAGTLADAARQRGPSGDLMLPTPTSRDWKDHTIRREPHRPDDVDTLARALTDVPCALLPTPAVNDMGEGKTVEKWDSWTDAMKAKHGIGNGHGKSLAIEARRLLPTLRTQNNENRQSEEYGGDDGNFYGLMQNPERWGDYAAAIQQWESVIGRPAPEPTQLSTKGNPQLSARFTEWLMGLPDGWVTDVPGITRNEALKACGNGVVPQQAAAALRWLLTVSEAAA